MEGRVLGVEFVEIPRETVQSGVSVSNFPHPTNPGNNTDSIVPSHSDHPSVRFRTSTHPRTETSPRPADSWTSSSRTSPPTLSSPGKFSTPSDPQPVDDSSKTSLLETRVNSDHLYAQGPPATHNPFGDGEGVDPRRESVTVLLPLDPRITRNPSFTSDVEG